MARHAIGHSGRVRARRGVIYRRCHGSGANGSNCRKVAIVAGGTVAADALVRQHRGRREPVNIVANVTILRRRHVARRLGQSG